jgi:hypothetical protein
MSNSDASTNAFLLLLDNAAAQSNTDGYVCQHNDGGYIHPLTVDLVRRTRLEIDEVAKAEARLHESAVLAETLTFMLYQAMSPTETSRIVSNPETLARLNRFLADRGEREREYTQRRQALLTSLEFVRERLSSQSSLCEHLAEEYKVPEYIPSEQASDTGAAGSSF